MCFLITSIHISRVSVPTKSAESINPSAKVDTPRPEENKPQTATLKGAKAIDAIPAGKKSLGQKEVIPFEWKLIGDAEGYSLTLFKAIEREEVEAQYERVQKEGYYKNLKILTNDEKVAQTKTAKKAKKAVESTKTKATATTKFGKTTGADSIVRISFKARDKKKAKAEKKKTKKTKDKSKKSTAKKKAVKKITNKKTAKKKTTNKKTAKKKSPRKTSKSVKAVKKSKPGTRKKANKSAKKKKK